jgi:hypothetical protein
VARRRSRVSVGSAICGHDMPVHPAVSATVRMQVRHKGHRNRFQSATNVSLAVDAVAGKSSFSSYSRAYLHGVLSANSHEKLSVRKRPAVAV